VSEQFLNSTSAQLGYTVPFMSVHAGKYRRQLKNGHTTKTKYNPKKQTMQNTGVSLIIKNIKIRT